MGKLINREKREEAKRQRAARKSRIFEEARSTFARMPFGDVTLATIGQQAGVDRGVASMYFRTKEELFLLLLKDELADWYRQLEERFGASEGVLDKRALAGVLAGSLADRPVLTRFLSISPAVLDQNIEAMEVYRFQSWRQDRMTTVGEAMERSVGDLAAGEGFRLLNLVNLLAAGFEPAAHPRGTAALDRSDPDFAGLWIDLEDELERLLTAVLAASRDNIKHSNV
jgi:AcrR family transcriptional regulator